MGLGASGWKIGNGNGHLGGFEWLVNRNKKRLVFHLSSQGLGHPRSPSEALLGFIPRRLEAPPTSLLDRPRKKDAEAPPCRKV